MTTEQIGYYKKLGEEQCERYLYKNPGNQVPPQNGIAILNLVDEIISLQTKINRYNLDGTVEQVEIQ